jgi:hypothetical protein
VLVHVARREPLRVKSPQECRDVSGPDVVDRRIAEGREEPARAHARSARIRRAGLAEQRLVVAESRRLDPLDVAEPLQPLVRNLTHCDPPLGRLTLAPRAQGGLLPHPLDRMKRCSVGRSLVERTVPRTTPPARPAALAVTDEPGRSEAPFDLPAIDSPLRLPVGLATLSGAHDEVVRDAHFGEGTTRVPRPPRVPLRVPNTPQTTL